MATVTLSLRAVLMPELPVNAQEPENLPLSGPARQTPTLTNPTSTPEPTAPADEFVSAADSVPVVQDAMDHRDAAARASFAETAQALVALNQLLADPTPTPEPPAATATPAPAEPTVIPTPEAGPAERIPAANPPTRIVAEAVGLDVSVVPIGWRTITENEKTRTVWNVAEYAAGWHMNSKLPGEQGNMVIAGHSDTRGEAFKPVLELEVGDLITVDADGRTYTYTVEERLVVQEKGASLEVKAENARYIGPFPDERLTLITCYPYKSNTHRLIIIARPAA
ncbi:MAG: sortase [Anaerolineae bacterium]